MEEKQKHETKVEPELSPIKEPSTGPKGKINWEIKDEELVNVLKSGAVLLAYSSNDPTEPTV